MRTQTVLQDSRTRTQRGFTLMELMVVLAIVGVVMGLAVPNFNLYIRNSRLTGATNDVLGSISRARTEAIKRQVSVAVCATNNPNAATPACVTTATAWRQGWVVWVDTDNDWVPDAVNEPVLERHPALDASLTVRSNLSDRVKYGATGFTVPPAAGFTSTTNIAMCDSRGTAPSVGGVSAARAIRISATGRPRATRTQADVLAALAAIGGPGCP
jgi:type IV fimbrial biogenesis protein FimT